MLRSALVSVLLLLLTACSGSSGPGGAPRGPRATDFTLTGVDGASVRLSSHTGSGKVVLLNFWATWCAPCAEELPHLQRLHEKHRERGLVVLGISMDSAQTVAKVGPFVERFRLTYPVLIDGDSQVATAYNPGQDAPLNVLIDRNGVIAWQKAGYLAGDEVDLEEQIDKLLEQKP